MHIKKLTLRFKLWFLKRKLEKIATKYGISLTGIKISVTPRDQAKTTDRVSVNPMVDEMITCLIASNISRHLTKIQNY